MIDNPFGQIEDISLKEYASNSAYERYMCIVLDPDKNEFKTLSGLFHDKKEVYDKMRKRGLVCRKVYEARIYEWILKNAKSVFDAYLMLSTAFSKWRGNNVLSDYYVKLLNDLPKINREKRKGDPQSIGNNSGWYKESTLTEDFDYEGQKKRLDYDYTTEHKIRVYPFVGHTNNEGNFVYNLLPEYSKGIPLTINTYDTNDPKRKFDDPLFYRELYKLATIDKIAGDPKATIAYAVEDDVINSNIKDTAWLGTFDKSNENWMNNIPKENWIGKDKWSSAYNNKTRPKGVTAYNFEPKNSGLEQLTNKLIDLENEYLKTSDEKKKNLLLIQIEDLKDQRYNFQNDSTPRLTNEEKQRIKDIKKEYTKIYQEPKPDELKDLPVYDERVKQWRQERKDKLQILKDERADILNRALYRNHNKSKNLRNKGTLNLERDELIKDYNSTFVPSNPIHGGDISKPMIAGLKRKNNAKKELERRLQAAKNAKDTGEIVRLKRGLNIQDPIKKSPTKINNRILEKARSVVLNKKADELKNTKEFSDANNIKVLKAAEKYFNNVENKKEYSDRLRKVYNDLVYNSSMSEAVQVNDGASWMYSNQKPMNNLVGTIEENTTKDKLNQKLFNGNVLRKDVRNALLQVADKFKTDLDLPFEPVDVYFTGSCANYNYNEYSDIDLHLVYDFEQAGVNAEILSNYLFSAKKVFNDKYNITVKDYPVEVGAENIAEPLVSSGVYSLIQNKWIKEPNNANTEILEPDTPFYNKIVNDIEEAIQSNNSTIIGDMWKELAQLRKISLAKEGEFGPGNTLFKILRNKKYLERLKDAYYNCESNRLSLESLEEIN